MSDNDDLKKLIPAKFLRVFQSTPPRRQHELRLVRTIHPESAQLVDIAEGLETLLNAGSKRLFRLVWNGKLDSNHVCTFIHNLRDELEALKSHLNEFARMVGLDELFPREKELRGEHKAPPVKEKKGSPAAPPAEKSRGQVGQAS